MLSGHGVIGIIIALCACNLLSRELNPADVSSLLHTAPADFQHTTRRHPEHQARRPIAPFSYSLTSRPWTGRRHHTSPHLTTTSWPHIPPQWSLWRPSQHARQQQTTLPSQHGQPNSQRSRSPASPSTARPTTTSASHERLTDPPQKAVSPQRTPARARVERRHQIHQHNSHTPRLCSKMPTLHAHHRSTTRCGRGRRPSSGSGPSSSSTACACPLACTLACGTA
jgi:hypothetical protein